MNPVRVEDHERVGHGVFNSKDAGKLPPRVRFWEDQLAYFGSEVSVDRLTYGNPAVLCEVHDDEATVRGPSRSFYGWYVLEVRGLRGDGFDVKPNPSTDARNIWHADLLILGVDWNNQDSVVQAAAKVKARVTDWEPRVLNAEAQQDVDEAAGGMGS